MVSSLGNPYGIAFITVLLTTMAYAFIYDNRFARRIRCFFLRIDRFSKWLGI